MQAQSSTMPIYVKLEVTKPKETMCIQRQTQFKLLAVFVGTAFKECPSSLASWH